MRNEFLTENSVDFSRIGKDKFTIMSELIKSKEIVQAVGCDDSDFLNDDKIIDDPSSLIQDRIIPFKFVPNVQEDKGTFITLSFDDYEPIRGQRFKEGHISFWIFSQNNKQYTDYGILRTDYIIDQIHKLFCRTRKLGTIGRVEFYRMTGISVNENYHGSVLTYKVYEWM